MNQETIVFENSATGALLLALGDGWRACIGANGTRAIDRAELEKLQAAGRVLTIRFEPWEWAEYDTPGGDGQALTNLQGES